MHRRQKEVPKLLSGDSHTLPTGCGLLGLLSGLTRWREPFLWAEGSRVSQKIFSLNKDKPKLIAQSSLLKVG